MQGSVTLSPVQQLSDILESMESMEALVVGGSGGLGSAIVEALLADGVSVTGASRTRPADTTASWIAVDFTAPESASATLAAQTPETIDTLIWNLGVWEPNAFTEQYSFADEFDATTAALVATNITGPIMALRALLPKVLASKTPRVILTGSTSALPRSGRPEVAFGASKTALNGIADALREGYRDQGLQVTTLQLGNLNTDDGLEVPREAAAARGDGTLIPVHDVVAVLRTLLSLSPASFIREIVMPATHDERL